MSRFIFDCTLHFSPGLFLFPWIEKRSSHGRALEHLESSGTKIMMRGPVVRLSCQRKTTPEKHRSKQTNKDL